MPTFRQNTLASLGPQRVINQHLKRTYQLPMFLLLSRLNVDL